MRRDGWAKQPTRTVRTNADAFADRKAAHDQAKLPRELQSVTLPAAQLAKMVDFVNDHLFCLRRGFPPGDSLEIVESPNGGSLLIVFRANTEEPVIVELVLRSPLRATITMQTIADISRNITLQSSDPFIRELSRDLDQRRYFKKRWLRDLLDDLEVHRERLMKSIEDLAKIEVELPLSDVVEGIVYAVRRPGVTA